MARNSESDSTHNMAAAMLKGNAMMGAGAGASPWAFLLGQPIGLACLAAGGGLTAAGLAWIDALARGIEADS